MLVLTEDSDGYRFIPHCFLLAHRPDKSRLMVSSLGLLRDQVLTGRQSFSPKFKQTLAQMNAIQALPGSPSEPIIKEWLKLPNGQ
jgi:hypothetical protein